MQKDNFLSPVVSDVQPAHLWYRIVPFRKTTNYESCALRFFKKHKSTGKFLKAYGFKYFKTTSIGYIHDASCPKLQQRTQHLCQEKERSVFLRSTEGSPLFMRKSTALCLLFFIVIQSAIFFYVRKFHSFAESKWILAASEGFLVMATVSWYVLIQPRAIPKKHKKTAEQPTALPIQPTKPDNRDHLIKTLNDEKLLLSEEMRQLNEAALFAKKRLADIEQEQNGIQRKLSESEGAHLEDQKTIDTCCHTIQSLTFEIDRLMTQIEQERRQHSIEVRAFLRKDEEDASVSPGKKKNSKSIAAISKMTTPPLPSLLLLLSTCQKGLDLHVAPDWPANEHRLLVRRKFFDIAKKMTSTPFAVVSLEHPTEYFLSSKLSPSLSINDIRASVLSCKNSFETLRQFEPYHFTDERLGGRWVAFRAAWSNLEDLIALAPTHTGST